MENIILDANTLSHIGTFNKHIGQFNEVMVSLHNNIGYAINRITLLWILTLIVWCFK